MIRKIPLQQRQTTFNEVSLGFNEEEAFAEAKRCLQCKNSPCTKGCPASIRIKDFIQCIQQKAYDRAIDIIRETNNLPAVCGRVCPQEEQCQLSCVLNKTGKPIQIGYLERFVADWAMENDYYPVLKPKNKKTQKIAVVGSGPGGLTCAADLAKSGYEVHLFEALHKCGGVLVYGIPEFRLPKHIVEKEVTYIEKLGVKIHRNYVIGKTQTIEQLRSLGFSVFFVATGAGLPKFLDIPGENANGVYSANEFLTRVNLLKAYAFPQYDTPVTVGKNVGVVGGGNVAFDCARSALRLGAKKVHIIYRRTKNEMPARVEEIENAAEEGIEFHLLTSPKEIGVDPQGNLCGIRCGKNQLGAPDASGRRSPQPIDGFDFVIEVDTLIIAVGTGANPLLLDTIEGLTLNKWGYITVDSNFKTAVDDIYAGGDIVSGSATVISAIGQAKFAAEKICLL